MTQSPKPPAPKESAPKEERSFMQKLVGDPFDGSIKSVTGGPFGWLLGELHGNRTYPNPTGPKWLGIFSAEDEGLDEGQGPAAQGSRAPKKGRTI